MRLINFLSVLALIEYAIFGFLVGRARNKYGVKAPAVTGNESFERYYRVQMNTLELLVLVLPGAWLSAQYRSHWEVSLLLGIYLIGRGIYFYSYAIQQGSRRLGFALSYVPAIMLVIGGLVGSGRELFMNGLNGK